jgi:hypothetical protein
MFANIMMMEVPIWQTKWQLALRMMRNKLCWQVAVQVLLAVILMQKDL